MKLTAIFLFALSLGVSANGVAQKVSLNLKGVTLEKVFFEIEKQTSFNFVYNTRTVAAAKPVTISVKEVAIDDVLKLAFKDQLLNYQVNDKIILVTPKTSALAETGVFQLPNDVPPALDVRGVVRDESGKPAAGVSVMVKGTQKGTTTNDRGEFNLDGVPENSTLVFSSVNLETFEIKVTADRAAELSIVLRAKISELADVTILSVNTGYQQIPKERATGSFVLIDSALFNRTYSTNVLDRLEGVTSGLAFNKNLPRANGTLQANNSILTIRGRSTINSNPEPLIVVDNFVYDGDLSTLNPDDIENITVLKDAGAAAIWGAYSGNGVIVITTKRGKYNQPLRVNVNSWLSTSDKPNIKYSPYMSSSDYIEVEQLLFAKGFYNSSLLTPRAAVSPVVELLGRRRSGLISAADSATAINNYRNTDSRDDILRYFYQNPVNQHYDVTFNGGGQYNKYYFAAGYDNNKSAAVRNGHERFTLRAANSYYLFNQKLEVSASILFQQSNSFNNAISGNGSNLPYVRIADNNGQALVTYQPSSFRLSYLDSAGQGNLLDWQYRPLDELRNNNNNTRLSDYHIDLSLKYKIIQGLQAEVYYNYNKGISDLENYQSQDLFFTRDLINQYSTVNFSTGIVTRPIPLGGILDRASSSYESQNVRGLINYSHSINNDHSISIVAGSEFKKLNVFSNTSRLYGYSPENATFKPLDYVTVFNQYTGGAVQIPSGAAAGGTTRNFISYFFLGGYTYKGRYSITSSVRKDESNLFGVSSNMKGVPLYSLGIGWNISKESFYKINWLPVLKLRATNGYQGNVNNTVAALTTIRYGAGNNTYGVPMATISNYPNDQLRWEKVNQLNIGLDFGLKNNLVDGSLEFFIKKAKDLIASTPLDPTSGTAAITTNVANMTAKGVDITINTKNITGRNFSWNSSLLFNYSIDKVTAYYSSAPIVSNFLTNQSINPIIGRPLYSIYAYNWVGLDSLGNPQVYLDGQVSKSYSSIGASKNIDNLHYMGPANPPFFGSILNKINYKKLSASFLITYKFGNYFRRASLAYGSLYSVVGGIGSPDYAVRWKNPGDEKITNVPSMVYPDVSGRDAVYMNSDILIEKGDYIRFQDIQVSYDLSSSAMGKVGIRSILIYTSASNLGILWRANKYGIDPDVVPGNTTSNLYPNPRAYTLGVKVGF